MEWMPLPTWRCPFGLIYEEIFALFREGLNDDSKFRTPNYTNNKLLIYVFEIVMKKQ
jgi:hypothetical protein